MQHSRDIKENVKGCIRSGSPLCRIVEARVASHLLDQEADCSLLTAPRPCRRCTGLSPRRGESNCEGGGGGGKQCSAPLVTAHWYKYIAKLLRFTKHVKCNLMYCVCESRCFVIEIFNSVSEVGKFKAVQVDVRKQTTAVRGSGTGAGRESRGGGARQCSEPELPAAAWPPRALTRVPQPAHSVIISSFAIPVQIFFRQRKYFYQIYFTYHGIV